MKQKVLPFSCIKLHFEGELFAPVSVGAEFELQSAVSVLVGIKGNPYKFKSAATASVWIDSNLIKTSKAQLTRTEHITKLELLNIAEPSDFLTNEINVINARNAGEWSVYFSDELLDEWATVVQGEQGLRGEQGLQGEQGVQGVKGDTGATGASGITWQFPVGHVLIDSGNTNPNTWLGYGTWAAFGAGCVLVGQDVSQVEFDTLGETGGEKTHTLTIAEMPSHNHGGATRSGQLGTGGGSNYLASNSTVTGNNGGNGAHNNLQPYLVVKFWKRTA